MTHGGVSAADSGARVGGWLLAIPGAGASLVPIDDEPQPGTRRSAREGVAGPATKPLRPGSEVQVVLPPGREVCVRTIEAQSEAIVGVRRAGLDAMQAVHGVRIRGATLRGRRIWHSGCHTELERHRVRVGPRTYLEPDDPGRIRHESVLFR